MSFPTGPDDPKYGGTGRHGVLPTGAPAWGGDLTALTDDELADRVTSLGRHIGNLHTRWDYQWDDGDHVTIWRPATPAELRETELRRWITARVAACQAQETRRVAAAEVRNDEAERVSA